MVSLEVGVDASGVVRGAREAFQALTQLSSGMQHMATLAEMSGGGGGALGKFGALMTKWHPLLTGISLAMGAVSIAMQAFGGRADEATDKWNALAEAVRNAKREADAAKTLGESPVSAMQNQLSAIRSALANVGQSNMSLDRFSVLTQSNRSDVLRGLAGMGHGDAQFYLRNGYMMQMPLGGFATPTNNPGGIEINPYQQEQLLIRRYRELSNQTAAESERRSLNWNFDNNTPQYMNGPWRPGAFQQWNAFSLPNVIRDEKAGQFNGVSMSEMEQYRLAEENARRASEAMDDLTQKGREFGATIGDAFFNVAAGTMTARQALTQLIMDLARATTQRAFGAFGAQIAGAFAGTASQAGGGSGGSGGGWDQRG